jgi:hypothetical protein
VPTVSKFTQNRKERILQVLRAGGSLRQAALAGEIDATTLGRWLEAGRTGHPNGRRAEFRRQVLEAEGTPPELQLLKDGFEVTMSDPASAWRFLEGLEREERAPMSSGPVKIEVVFAPFTPPVQEGDRA